MIFVAANRPALTNETPLLTEPPDLETPYPDVAAVIADGSPLPVGKPPVFGLSAKQAHGFREEAPNIGLSSFCRIDLKLVFDREPLVRRTGKIR